jgi:hypothetical protein
LSTRQKLKGSRLAELAHAKRNAARLEGIASEQAAIEADKQRKRTAVGKRPTGEKVIEETERSEDTGELVRTKRTVKKYLTTLDNLEKRGQLDKHLRMAFDQLAEAVALSSGACIDDRDLRGSSARGIVSLDSNGGSTFGPRSVSEMSRRGENLRKAVMAAIPQDMMKLANHLLMEETGLTLERPAPLTEYGQANGFNQEQQARSSGATMAIDVCRVVHHALKSQ